MGKRDKVFLDVADPVGTIVVPHGTHLIPCKYDHLLISLEGCFEAKVVCQLSKFEILEAEDRVKNQEKCLLHLHLVEQKLKVALQDLQDEENDPKMKWI